MKKLLILPILAALALTAGDSFHARALPPPVDSTPPVQMKQYWMVLLLKGPNRGQDSAAAARIQEAHMRNINQLAAEGRLIMAGPVGSNGDLRGIFIFDAKDSAQAASFVSRDSAVQTGRLRFELHPWWTAKGTYTFR